MSMPRAPLFTVPHRWLFAVGAAQVSLAMAWWAAWWAGAAGLVPAVPASGAPPGWLHALLMQYQVLPSFMFGFLMTVFPRWMDQAPTPRGLFLPTGAGLLLGQALVLAGAWGLGPDPAALVLAGTATSLAAWGLGLVALWRPLWADAGRSAHAVAAFSALLAGAGGLLAFLAFLLGADPQWAFASIKIGSFALLLPVYLVVLHRMLPFFASRAVPGHVAWPTPPGRAMALVGLACALHLALELVHGYAWLWLVDAPFALLLAGWLWRQWPRRPMPPLLRVLFLGAAWGPLAFALFAAQSAWFAATGAWVLARAPAHALYIGLFGSLLVAMVTRVTQGHSGRPLELGRVAAFAFIGVQVAAVLRLVAEAAGPAWQAAAACAWLLAFAPWVLRSTWIWLTPRADGRPDT